MLMKFCLCKLRKAYIIIPDTKYIGAILYRTHLLVVLSVNIHMWLDFDETLKDSTTKSSYIYH